MECHDILSGSPLQPRVDALYGGGSMEIPSNNNSYFFLLSMSRITSTMTISLPKELKKFVKERSRTEHFGTPSGYIQGLASITASATRVR